MPVKLAASSDNAASMKPGLLYALLAFGTWGLIPLYLHRVGSVPPLELVLHRSTWSLLLMVLVLTLLRRWAWLVAMWRQPRQLLPFACSALTTGAEIPRVGNQGYSGSPAADMFECRDGWLAPGANTPAQLLAS